MHNLVADPTDTFAAGRRQCNYGGISPSCSPRQNGVATEVHVHFAENRPNPQRRVLLRSLLPHFWYIDDSSYAMCYFLKYFEEFAVQDASSRSAQVSRSTRTMLCLSACVYVCCLCAFCITWSLIWWTIVRTYVSALQASPYAVYVHTFAYECSHSIRSSTACWANVLRASLLGSLVSSKWHIPHRA